MSRFLGLINKKKRIRADSVVLSVHRAKLKFGKWKVTVIPIVVRVLVIVPNDQEKRFNEQENNYHFLPDESIVPKG